VSIKHLHNL